MRPRLIIADDHEIVRHGLIRIIEEHGRWEIVADATDGRAALELARLHRPDVAVLDYAMPVMNGLEATRAIRSELERTEVLVLTMHDNDVLVREVLEAGAKGYILKSDAGRVLIDAIETLLDHKPYFTPRVSELVLRGYLNASAQPEAPESPGVALTARERQVLQLLAEGHSTKEVATELDLSIKTAETHRANLMRKLGVRSVADLVRYAIRNKIIEA